MSGPPTLSQIISVGETWRMDKVTHYVVTTPSIVVVGVLPYKFCKDTIQCCLGVLPCGMLVHGV